MTRVNCTMNALVLDRVGHASYKTIPRPEPLEGQVRIRVGFCGVCGSDLPRFFDNGPYSMPLVCGHEFAGVIEKIGPGVKDLHVGGRVTVFPLIWCGSCTSCEQGLYGQCLRYDYVGSRSDGAFAEYVVVPARNTVSVPNGLSLEEAAMTEPVAVGLHALRRAGNCSVGECVAVFGAGPIGLIVAQWARLMGASTVAIFDIVREKLDLACRVGLTNVYDSRQQDPVVVIQQLTNGAGAEICIDAAGVPQTILQALRAAGRRGRVILLGNPADDLLLDREVLSQILRREMRMMGTWNSEYRVTGRDDWHDAIAAMERGYITVKPLISHRVKLRESFDVLKMMRDRRDFYCKVLVYPEPES